MSKKDGIFDKLADKFDELFGDAENSNEENKDTTIGAPADLTDDNAAGESEKDLPRNIVLTDEKGKDAEFEFLDIIQYNGEDYVVLLPAEESDEAGEVVILKIEGSGDDNESYVSIDDDNALMLVFEIFKERNKDLFNFVD
ncbi:MAG: DUF1292 domain-containing protein [Clostridia bacterium]|nr:DUF1292 domain-containing protein [Clostridia bacterium]